MNLISYLVLGLVLLTVCGVVVVTFVHKYDNTHPAISETLDNAKTLDKIHLYDISNIKGNIASLQYNGSSIPFGILSGSWKIIQLNIDNKNGTAPEIDFTSNITNTAVDGASRLTYQLREFKNSNVALADNSATINGTVTLIAKQKSDSNARPEIRLVPLSITIMNLKTIRLNLDKDLVQQYFGDSPIYGFITN